MIVQHKLTQFTVVDFDKFCPKIILVFMPWFILYEKKSKRIRWYLKLKIESQWKPNQKNVEQKSATSWLMSLKHMLKHCVLKWKIKHNLWTKFWNFGHSDQVKVTKNHAFHLFIYMTNEEK